MHKPFIYIVLFLIGCINSTMIPSVNNITLVPLTDTNSTTLYNITCDQCLCKTVPTHAVLNCFPNDTCQYFLTIPSLYRIESSPQARLFFPNGQIPSQSQCCMKNTTELIAKLQNGSQISTKISSPISVYDADDGVLFALDYYNRTILGYDMNNLTVVLKIKLNSTFPLCLAYNYGYFYVALENNSIIIVNRTSRTLVNTIKSPYLSEIYSIIFLQKGEIMVCVSISSQSLVFLRRLNNSATNYSFYFIQAFPSVQPYILHYINDTFLLGVSWDNALLFSFNKVNSTFWKTELIVNVSLFVADANGNYVTTDQCGRIWFVTWAIGILIFDQRGAYLGFFFPQSITYISEVLITRNNILYFADFDNSRIVRIDPGIPC